MTRTIRLTYEVSYDRTLEDAVGPAHATQFAPGGETGEYQVTLGREALVVSGDGWTAHHDLQADERVLLDHRDETVLRTVQASTARPVAREPLRTVAEKVGDRRNDYPVEGPFVRSVLDTGPVTVTVTALSPGRTPTRSTAALWDVVLPSHETEGLGVPVELSVSGDDGSGWVRLVGWEDDAKPPGRAGVPSGYRPVGETGDETDGAGRVSNDREENETDGKRGRSLKGVAVGGVVGRTVEFDTTPTLPLRGELRDLTRASKRLRSLRDRRTHTQRRQGQDLAWLVDQAGADDLQGFVNDVVAPFGEFYGDGAGGDNPMHVEVDWWSALDDRLDFGEHDTEVRMALKRLVLYALLMNDEALPTASEHPGGLSAAEQVAMEDVRQQADAQATAALPASVQRVLVFQQEFDGPRRDELAEAVFEGGTAPIDLTLGPTEMSDTVVGDTIRYRLWDFDTTLDLGSTPVDELRFEDGRLRLVLALDELFVDFQYSTVPTGDWKSVLCGIFTLGACTVMQSNYGYGYFRAEDIRIALDVQPQRQGGEIGLVVTFDRDDSSMDTSAALLGLNLAQDLITGVVTAIQSAFDSFNDDIFDAIEDAIEADLLDTSMLRWPVIWNAVQGPPLGTVAGVFEPGQGAFEAELANDAGLPYGYAAALDGQHVDQTGFVFSRRFLIAWLRELTGMPPGESSLPVQPVLDEFDVTLPDVSAVEMVDDEAELESIGDRFGGIEDRLGDGRDWRLPRTMEGCEPPATPPDEVSRRLRFVRSAPTVRFPEHSAPTAVTSAGELVVGYDLEIATVVEEYTPIARIVPGRCIDLDGGRLPRRPGGAQPDPVPPYMARRPAVERVAHEGIPMGTTVGERTRYFEAIERVRSLRETLGGTVVDRLRSPRAGADIQERADGRRMPTRTELLDALGGVETGQWVGSGGWEPGAGTGTPRPDGGEGLPRAPADPRWTDPTPDGDGGLGGFGFPMPGGGPGGIPGRVCEPPHCEWTIQAHERVTQTFLRAHVEVVADLELGFQPLGGFWLPELAYQIADTGGLLSGFDPDFRVSVSDLELGDVFDGVPEAAVRNSLSELCSDDASAMLAAGTGSGPLQSRTLVPSAARLLFLQDMEHWGWSLSTLTEVTTVVEELVTFTQDAQEDDAFHYTVDGDLLYWPVRIDQTLTDHLT